MEGLLPTIVDAIKALGVAGGPVFAVLWWLERTERKECQKASQDLLVQTLEISHRATSALGSSTAAVTELRGVLNTSIASLSSMIKSLKRA